MTMKATSALEWRKKTIFVVEIEEGFVAELRRPDPTAFLSNGDDIPSALRDLIARQISGEAPKDFNAEDLPPEMLVALIQLRDKIVRAAFVSPRVVMTAPDYEAGEISFEDVSKDQKQFVYDWVMHGREDDYAAGANFPEKSVSGVPDVPAVTSLGNESG